MRTSYYSWVGSVSMVRSRWRRSAVRLAVPERGRPRSAPCWKSTVATVAILGWRYCRPRSSSMASSSCSRSIAPCWRRPHPACSASGCWSGWPCSSLPSCKVNAVLARSTPARASRRSSASRSRRQRSWKGLPCLRSYSPSLSAAESRKDEMIMAEAQGAQSSGVSTAPAVESAGVESLIGRLRDEGITQGRTQAEALVTAAQQQAADLVATAQRDAEAILARAKEEAGKLKAAGEDAIRLAMRDTILALEGDLLKEFVDRLRRLVKGVLADPAFLQRLILEVAGRVAPTGEQRAEVLLPAELVSLEDLQRKPEEATPGSLMHFVLSLGGGMLREGMYCGVSEDGEAGIRVRLVEEDVQIDVTE